MTDSTTPTPPALPAPMTQEELLQAAERRTILVNLPVLVLLAAGTVGAGFLTTVDNTAITSKAFSFVFYIFCYHKYIRHSLTLSVDTIKHIRRLVLATGAWLLVISTLAFSFALSVIGDTLKIPSDFLFVMCVLTPQFLYWLVLDKYVSPFLDQDADDEEGIIEIVNQFDEAKAYAKSVLDMGREFVSHDRRVLEEWLAERVSHENGDHRNDLSERIRDIVAGEPSSTTTETSPSTPRGKSSRSVILD